jgi:hypothetical protein
MFKRNAARIRMVVSVTLGICSMTAGAGVQAQGTGNNQSSTRPHCVSELAPIRPGETASVVTPRGCFATFAEAIAAATNGSVKLARNVRPQSLTNEMLAPASVTGSTVIGIHYQYYNFSENDPSWTWTTTQLAACNGYTYGERTMPSWWWNNSVSSAKPFDNCTRFENYDLESWDPSGDKIVCNSSGCPTMGTMDNRTSSWRLTN